MSCNLAPRKQHDTGRNIKCTYSDKPNHTRNCFYNEYVRFSAIYLIHLTGSPKRGNSYKCPGTANSLCPPKRREAKAIYQAYEDQMKRRAAQPEPTIPEYMKKRAALKKRED
ncbi:hypothetical protein NMY22_g8192 [Coprinellus aureogranulatus]|nr:hypothetical protein NMY22_g8192 [Coprinellus aureogranulatus]